ncbi:g6162 [Coccomyxa viridis]|uniref:G6162 protein n=1 Tax=Coccomyxa viridis TaxID=1274662 RepID=A0ABP1FUQ9_9CHLO
MLLQGEEDDFIREAATEGVRVHPLSLFRRNWDLTAIALTIYTLLVLPFRAAFYWEYYRDLEMHHSIIEQLEVDWMLLIELLIDFFFLTDIALNFNTGYIAEQVLVMEPKTVAVHYLRTWFVLDLFASLPLDLLLRGRRLDILRLPRLLKIIRMMHYKSFSQAVHDLRRSPLVSSISRFHIQIIQLFAFVFVWVHWDACLQYGACASQPPSRYAQPSVDARRYGKQDPITTLDCWLTILSMLLGVCIWTFLGGIVTTLLIHLNAASSEYTAKITALNQYMAHRKLPQGLRQRIRDSYEARWKAEKHFDEEEIMHELPNSLRTEARPSCASVCLYTCGDLIANVPFFEDAEEGFTTSVVTLLRPVVYLKDDMVIREGEVSREMYFIKSGAVQVEVNEGVVTVLKKGSYFGEIGLLRTCRRTASIRAISENVDLFVLSKDDFDNVMREYPESSKAMDLIAEHRLRSLHASAAWRSKQDALHDAKMASLGAKIEHVLELEEGSLENSSPADDSHQTTSHTTERHSTGNPFATGNITHAAEIQKYSLHNIPSSSAAASTKMTADGRRQAIPGAGRGSASFPVEVALRPLATSTLARAASNSPQGSPYALQRTWTPNASSPMPSDPGTRASTQ